VHATIALTASLSLVVLCCNPGRACAAETAHAPPKTGAATSFDLRDLTGIWLQTPERPFKTLSGRGGPLGHGTGVSP